MIKLFFTKTFYFWLIVRALIMLSLFSALIMTDNLEEIQVHSLRAFIYYLAHELYIISLLILFLQFFSKKERTLLIKLYAGSYSIYYGMITGLALYEEDKIYFLIFPFLLFIYGIWQMYFDKGFSNKIKTTANTR